MEQRDHVRRKRHLHVWSWEDRATRATARESRALHFRPELGNEGKEYVTLKTFDDDEQLDSNAFAELIGVTPSTLRGYLLRQQGFPEPDGYLGRQKWWWRSTVLEWNASRPGPGRWGNENRHSNKTKKKDKSDEN